MFEDGDDSANAELTQDLDRATREWTEWALDLAREELASYPAKYRDALFAAVEPNIRAHAAELVEHAWAQLAPRH